MKGRLLPFGLCLGFALSACVHMPRIEDVTSDPLSAAEHRTLARQYLRQHERLAAQEQYRMALAKNPGSVSALVALGNMAFEDRRWTHARAYYYRAWKLQTGDPAIANNLAMVDVMEK